MRQIKSDFWRKCQFPLMMLLGTIPVTLYVIGAVDPRWLYYGWVIGIAYAVLALFTLLVPGKRRIVCGLLGCASLLVLGVWPMITASHWAMMVPSVFYCILLMWGLQMCGWNWDEELPSLWYWIGIVVHTAAQIAYSVSEINAETEKLFVGMEAAATVQPLFIAARPGTLAAFFGFMLLAMLSMNRDCMASASMGRQKVSASMRRKNVVFTLGFFVVAVVIALIPAVAEGVTAAWNWLSATILAILNAIVQRIVPTEAGGASVTDSNSPMEGLVGKGPSEFALVTQQIMIVVGCVLVAAALLALLYILGKKLMRLLLWLMKKANRFAAAASEDYEDEVTDTRDLDDQTRARRRRHRRTALADDRSLAPGERIRRRYLRLLYKHPEWTAGRTARENLPAEAAPLYERARYSDHAVTEEEAERFAAGIKRL